MKTLIKARYVALLLLCILFQAALAQQPEENRTASDKAQFSSDQKISNLRIADKGQTVLIEIHTTKATNAQTLPEQPKFSELTVTKISINIDGKEILVPKSAVDYLVDVNRCSIKRDRNGWALSIDGRDGAYGYLAVIYFDREQVRRRAMYADVNQSHMTEEIRYMPPDVIN